MQREKERLLSAFKIPIEKMLKLKMPIILLHNFRYAFDWYVRVNFLLLW